MTAKWNKIQENQWALEDGLKVLAVVTQTETGGYSWTIFASVSSTVDSRKKEHAQGVVEFFLAGQPYHDR